MGGDCAPVEPEFAIAAVLSMGGSGPGPAAGGIGVSVVVGWKVNEGEPTGGLFVGGVAGGDRCAFGGPGVLGAHWSSFCPFGAFGWRCLAVNSPPTCIVPQVGGVCQIGLWLDRVFLPAV